VRERPRTLEELYDNFQKFSRSDVLHFRKLGQQRETINKNEGSRPTKYSKSIEKTSNFDTTHNRSIALTRMDVDHLKTERKISDLRAYKVKAEHIPPEEIITQEEVIQIEAKAGGDIKIDLRIACSMSETQTIG
jgi:hypothetical protein